MKRSSISFAASVLTVVALAGCSAGGDTNTSDAPVSPLNEYLGAAYGSGLSEEEQQLQFEEQQKALEAAVAVCMKDAGFDYTPNIQTGVVFSSDGVEYEPDDRDWVSQYGYGAVNSPWTTGGDPMESDMPEDPNSEYLNSLSASEQQAYQEALYGAPPEPDESGNVILDGYNLETAGCFGAAAQEAYPSVDLEKQFESLFAAMNTFWENIEKDPAYAKLNADWAACMADAGRPGFTLQGDAEQSIYDKVNEFYANNQKAMEEGTFSENDPALAKIGEEEIELALVDLGCREKTNFTETQQKIQFDLEEQFVRDNKAELEAYKAAAEQAG